MSALFCNHLTISPDRNKTHMLLGLHCIQLVAKGQFCFITYFTKEPRLHAEIGVAGKYRTGEGMQQQLPTATLACIPETQKTPWQWQLMLIMWQRPLLFWSSSRPRTNPRALSSRSVPAMLSESRCSGLGIAAIVPKAAEKTATDSSMKAALRCFVDPRSMVMQLSAHCVVTMPAHDDAQVILTSWCFSCDPVVLCCKGKM